MPKAPPDPGTWESRYREQLRRRPEAIGLIAEGDSWFSFPNYLRTNLFLEIERWSDDRAVTWSLARNGDTAAEIMFGQQYQTLRRLFSDATLKVDGFLFSAGGNDLVAENLPNFLNTYTPGMQWMDCLNMTFLDRRFQELASAFQRLADLRDAYKPQTWIFTHAYDFAVPSGREVRVLIFTQGGWLKKQFLKKGIEDPSIQQAIVDHMLTRFASLQEHFEQTNSRIAYVRTQGTLDQDTDWGDELHPTIAGFRKIAFKLETALKDIFPSLPAPSRVALSIR